MADKQAGMSLIVKTITRLTVGLILIYGIYIVFNGHMGPGGGFAGGIIIALSFIHLMLAFGREEVLSKLNKTRGLILSGSGALLFLACVFSGIRGANSVIVSDLAIALMVGTGLFTIFLALILLTREKT